MAKDLLLIPACFIRNKCNTENKTLESWEAGRDFKINGGPYCSIRDFEELKKLADYIYLVYVDAVGARKQINIWTHPLAGVTNYV